MARTAIPVSTFTSGVLLNNAGTAIDQSNGMYVDLSSTAIPAANGSEDLFLYITNSDSGTHTVTVRAGVGGGATPGAAFRSGLGDLTTGAMTGTTGTAFIGPLDSMRFAQLDGKINVDFNSGAAGKVWALLIPRTPAV